MVSPIVSLHESLDELTQLQLCVARRADELAGARRIPALNVHCWLLAEAEVFRSRGASPADFPTESMLRRNS